MYTMSNPQVKTSNLHYSWKYWRELKCGSWVPICHIEFGVSVRDCHMYNIEGLVHFNLAIAQAVHQTTKFSDYMVCTEQALGGVPYVWDTLLL